MNVSQEFADGFERAISLVKHSQGGAPSGSFAEMMQRSPYEALAYYQSLFRVTSDTSELQLIETASGWTSKPNASYDW